jgi:adenine phosphoribosyltransferase
VSVGPPDGDEALSRVAALVRDIPDFPEPGVVFRDITPVLADSEAFRSSP